MKITLNGEATEIIATTLDAAVDELGYTGKIVATAVNGDFVAREARGETMLVEGDRLEVVAPLQGG
ncbi:MAG: sulfur carrier protein ThiS [Pseudomonadota bacterium]